MSGRGPLLALVVALCVLGLSPGRADIAGTRHDLSHLSTRAARGGAGDRCKPCHVSHGGKGKGPLWAVSSSPKVFVTGASRTTDAFARARPQAPDGASALCLGCHDGTVAATSLTHGAALLTPRRGREEVGAARTPLDLSGSHPVSFVYSEELVARNNAKDLPLKPPSAARAAGVLDAEGKVQCTSCHDPHDDSNHEASGVPFYRGRDFSEVCSRCHDF